MAELTLEEVQRNMAIVTFMIRNVDSLEGLNMNYVDNLRALLAMLIEREAVLLENDKSE